MGKSLGIDPLSDAIKICNLNCVYCQLGKTSILTNERKEYVPTEKILDEVRFFFNQAQEKDRGSTADIDYLTFSGRGEPTLAKNLGAMIKGVREIRHEEIAVITNSTLLHLLDVQQALALSDLVIAKLDACDERSFREIDKAKNGLSFEKIVEGIKTFKKYYRGKLAIQIMFVEQNRRYAKEIADIVRGLNADEIQINTPLRPSAAKPLDPDALEQIKLYFAGMPAATLYERDRKETIPLNEKDTIKRHGNYKNTVINNS